MADTKQEPEAQNEATDDQKRVWEACDALDAEGLKPTYEAVRRKLGGGSYSTLASGIKSWEPKGAQPLSPVPPAIVDRVQGFAVAIWKDATAAAQAAFELERADLGAKISQLEIGIVDYEQDQRDALTELEELRSSTADLRNRNHELELQLRELTGALKALEGLKRQRRVGRRKERLAPSLEKLPEGAEARGFEE